MPRFKDLSGLRFGRLTAKSRAKGAFSVVHWDCECDCGTQRTLPAGSLTKGLTRSCGCLNDEVRRQKKKLVCYTDTPTHKIWERMLARCRYSCVKGWSRYGGRGITVCERWQKFANFLADMGERPSTKHSIDRINNDGNYEPGNCRWATTKVQANNRSNNRLLTVNGVSRTLQQWADERGIGDSTIRERLRWGWTVRDAVMTPPQFRGRAVVNARNRAQS